MEKWKTLSYFEVTDESDGSKRWFPKLIELEQNIPSVFQIAVHEASINPVFPEGFFLPDLPDGSQVNDLRIDGKVETYIKGEEPYMSDTIQKSVEIMRKSSNGQAKFWLYSNILVVSALTVLVIYRYRSKQTTS